MSAATRRRIVCCPECKRVMKSVLEIEEDETEADPHLYLLTASDFLTGLVKIGRSHKPFERALQLSDGLPFHFKVFSIFPSLVRKSKKCTSSCARSVWRARRRESGFVWASKKLTPRSEIFYSGLELAQAHALRNLRRRLPKRHRNSAFLLLRA